LYSIKNWVNAGIWILIEFTRERCVSKTEKIPPQAPKGNLLTMQFRKTKSSVVDSEGSALFCWIRMDISGPADPDPYPFQNLNYIGTFIQNFSINVLYRMVPYCAEYYKKYETNDAGTR
jgi:hypothetical protein